MMVICEVTMEDEVRKREDLILGFEKDTSECHGFGFRDFGDDYCFMVYWCLSPIKTWIPFDLV